ncbi:hypothetical protein GCM10018779_10330 [Streptomyces griseocarneus]|nr:hypothetical protein GCM10018779_10330 [Streptomyces griseocarneus]
MGQELLAIKHPRLLAFKNLWESLPLAALPTGPGPATVPYEDVSRTARALWRKAAPSGRFTDADLKTLRAVADSAGEPLQTPREDGARQRSGCGRRVPPGRGDNARRCPASPTASPCGDHSVDGPGSAFASYFRLTRGYGFGRRVGGAAGVPEMCGRPSTARPRVTVDRLRGGITCCRSRFPYAAASRS